jgi:hypothetical protein
MKKTSLLIGLVLVTSNPYAATPRLDWNENLMRKTCIDAVSNYVLEEAGKGVTAYFGAKIARVELLTDETFVCLIIGERRVTSPGGEKREAKAYSAVVKPFPTLRAQVQALPSL